MKSEIIEEIYRSPFEEVYKSLKENILDTGFLLLHEIDTQRIVARQGYEIPLLKQLLFFHPKYIHAILENDPLAINEIPIKIVCYQLENGDVSVSVPNPVQTLIGFNGMETIGNELLEIILKVLKKTGISQ